MKTKVLILVDNYRSGEQINQLISFCRQDIEVVGVEYNGALGLEQFQQFLPQIVILDVSIPIIGLDQFVQLMQDYTMDFIIILLDDRPAFETHIVQNICRVLPKNNLTSASLNEAIASAISLISQSAKKLSSNYGKEYYEEVSSLITNDNVNIELLHFLHDEFSWNLSTTFHILMLRPKQKITGISHHMLNDIQGILNSYHGGAIFVTEDGMPCIFINAIEGSEKCASESLYEQLIFEIGHIVRNNYQLDFLFLLSNSCNINNLSMQYAYINKLVHIGYFQKEMDLITVNSVSKTVTGLISDKLNNIVEDLTAALFDPHYISFKRHLESAYISVLKPSMQVDSVQQFRSQLELLYHLLISIYIPQDTDLSDAFGNSHFTIEEEYEAVDNAFRHLYDIIAKSDRPPLGHNIIKVIGFCLIRYDDNLISSDYARLISVTPSYLSHFFKARTGIAFSDFLTNIKIIRAKRLLKSTQMKIVDISDTIGFLDYHYFSRVFRKITGMTPTLYRARQSSANEAIKIV